MTATSKTSLKLLASRNPGGVSKAPPQIPHKVIPHMRLLAAVFGKSVFEIATQVKAKASRQGS